MPFRKRFKVGTPVYSVDDELVGHIDRLITDPITREVTHLIVRQKSETAEAQVIPVGWVGSVREQDVTLFNRADKLHASSADI